MGGQPLIQRGRWHAALLAVPHSPALSHRTSLAARRPEQRPVVELDSREFHSHWEAAERDRARDATLLQHGITSLRVTKRMLTRQRAGLVSVLRTRLPVR